MDALQIILMAIVHTVTLPEMGTLHGEKPWTSHVRRFLDLGDLGFWWKTGDSLGYFLNGRYNSYLQKWRDHDQISKMAVFVTLLIFVGVCKTRLMGGLAMFGLGFSKSTMSFICLVNVTWPWPRGTTPGSTETADCTLHDLPSGKLTWLWKITIFNG